MKRNNKLISLSLAALLLLSGCGNNETATNSSSSTEGTTEADVYSNSTEEVENSTSAGSQQEDSYDYPDSLKSDLEPTDRRAGTSNLYFKVPGIFDHEWNASPAPFLKYTDENDNIYYFTEYACDWVDDVPDWMDADHMEYTLDTVPDYLKYDFVKSIDSAPGIDPGKHYSPFNMKNTEFNLETEESAQINGENYIKWTGTAHAENSGMDITVYFSCYFYLLDDSMNSKFDTTPAFITVMTQDCSDAGKQLVNDAADYAVTNSFRK